MQSSHDDVVAPAAVSRPAASVAAAGAASAANGPDQSVGHASSNGTVARESQVSAKDDDLQVSEKGLRHEPTGSAPPSNDPEDGSAGVSPKPKIRIKLKVSPKRATSNMDDGASGATETGAEDEEDWLCLKCINNNEANRIRCWNCKGWKGGKRENFNPNKNKEGNEEEDDPMEVDPTAAAGEAASSSKCSATETGKDEEVKSDDDAPMVTLKQSSKKNKPSMSDPTTDSSPSSQPPSTASKPKPAPPKSSSEPKKKRSHPKTKLFSGTLRSAAAAHRNRQIHVPPIGSPGLLMLPNPALVANFPQEDGTVDKKRKTAIDDVSHLLHNGYILPRTVYEQSMVAGGYTWEKRMDQPHRGSSTQRTVGDMFDSDVSLYLHFPELIPLDLWERRLKMAKVEPKEEMETDQAPVKTDKDDGDQSSEKKESGSPKKSTQQETTSDKEVKGPLLVEMMIQSLSKMTGNELHKVDDHSSSVSEAMKSESSCFVSVDPSQPDVNDSAKPDTAPSDPIAVTESSAPDVTSDTEPRMLPKLNPDKPETRKRSRPHHPMSFLDMIPISLTCTYPPDYVKKRRAYSQAVKEREHLIVESQEAADDAVDNKEKYEAHKEAWDRMFEYQKLQIAKREAAAEEAERKAKEEAEQKAKECEQKETTDIKPGTDAAAENNGDADVKSEPVTSKTNGDAASEVRPMETKKEVPTERKKEDPMDYMPKPPEPPPPERFIAVPDIPDPPSPPSVLEIDKDSMVVDEKGKDTIKKICIPSVDPKLIRHLDPACFLPNGEGRYFGLLSNYIADPQFVGPTATGIRGVTSGGGTGLATSYVGGGRGAAGLVSGPLRGGMNSWQQRESQSSSKSSGKSNSKSASKKKPSAAKTALLHAPKKEKNEVKPSQDKSSPASSSSKKRRASETEEGSDSGSSKKKAKSTKHIPLATGDRNTLATEIASGPAGEEFPDGWTVKTYRRAGGETVGKTDRFWFSPGLNIRFRAKKHAMSFIDILDEPECNGDEQIAAETYRARGLHF